jgi:hypothetical protein
VQHGTKEKCPPAIFEVDAAGKLSAKKLPDSGLASDES